MTHCQMKSEAINVDAIAVTVLPTQALDTELTELDGQ